MSRKILLVVRVVTVLLGLYFVYCYNLESSIINKTRIFSYPITEVHCSNGKGGSSYFKIIAAGKTYEVPVKKYNCGTFEVGGSAQLYYNHLMDYYFLDQQGNPSKIVGCIIFFGLTFLWQAIDRYKRNKEANAQEAV